MNLNISHIASVLLLCWLVLAPQNVHGQNSGNVSAQSAVSEQSSVKDDERNPIGSSAAEMMARNQIKYFEKMHQENVERAREAAKLSAELRETYILNKSLGQFEKKKLDRLEKLTRRIRSEAGGSTGDAPLEDEPRKPEAALDKLTEISEAMRDGVEKTPRMVISAFVIENANELLQTIRQVRALTR